MPIAPVRVSRVVSATMTAESLFRSGGLRVLISPVLTLVFVALYGVARGAFEIPGLSQMTGVDAFWIACTGFALVELIWPCDKVGAEAGHSLPARAAYAVIVGMGLAGIGYGTVSILAAAV